MHPTDHGPAPFVTGLCCEAKKNICYRRTLWTGDHLQLTLMCIPPQGEIGLEVHHKDDQLLRVESGCGTVMMGESRDCLTFHRPVRCGDAIFVPAHTWHNVVNAGRQPLKLTSVYTPPHHPHGTVHRTKAESDVEGD